MDLDARILDQVPTACSMNEEGDFNRCARSDLNRAGYCGSSEIDRQARPARHVADRRASFRMPVRCRIKNASADKGDERGLTSDQLVEFSELHEENAELPRANETLKAASAYFPKKLRRSCAG